MLQLSGKHATKQAVYAALRKLKSEEIIVIYKGIVALNTAWVKDLRTIVMQMQKAYGKEKGDFDFLSLGNKESVLYSFSNMLHLDTFWGHVQTLLVNATPQTEPIYAYNPHYWFYIARKKTERRLLDDLISQSRQFLITVGGKTKLDKIIRSDFTSHYTQYAFKKLYNRPEYYISAIGDYLIEVTLDKNIAKMIDSIYQKYEVITPEVIQYFKKLLETRGRHKIKISHNNIKANALRKKLVKNFFIKN